jgi:hypothetical protein
MAKPQWLLDVELKQLRLKDMTDSTHSYAGKDPSTALYELNIEIVTLAQQIADLYRENLPVR